LSSAPASAWCPSWSHWRRRLSANTAVGVTWHASTHDVTPESFSQAVASGLIYFAS
jgi:hypothetical protein